MSEPRTKVIDLGNGRARAVPESFTAADIAAYRARFNAARNPAQRTRAYYGLPDWVRQGCRVRYTYPSPAREGVVTSFTRTGMYVRIRLDGDKRSGAYHPTWELTYISPEGVEHHEP